MMATPFALTHEERTSPLWRRLHAHLLEQIDALRIENDGAHSEGMTARLRGRIAELKMLAALNNEPNPEAHPAPFQTDF